MELEDGTYQKSEMSPNDAFYNIYTEFVTERVPASKIKNIYLPQLLKHRIELPDWILEKITWVGMTADHYSSSLDDFVPCPEDILKQFAETTPLNSDWFNFFRGMNPDRTMIDIYNVKYWYGEE